jgi:hypothetical protein
VSGESERYPRVGSPELHTIHPLDTAEILAAALYPHYRLDAAGIDSAARRVLARRGPTR